MNALATDQAGRLNDLLANPELSKVTAGLYIGDSPDITYRHVMTERSDIRRERPDILITNYKMLDLLLQRGDDLPLWRDASIGYVVVDEFHTYDGAQGTDVAMLLRRLAAATGHAEPGRPLGGICPVATSATLGEGSDEERIREVAEQVFGAVFPAGSVITEQRLPAAEFLDPVDYSLPLPAPQELWSHGDPRVDDQAMTAITKAVTGQEALSPAQLGSVLRRHQLTHGLIDVLGDKPSTPGEILQTLPKHAYSWGAAWQQSPERTAAALARFVALLSTARNPEDETLPFLHIETHLWIRPLSRVLRSIGPNAMFGWYGEAAPEAESTVGGVPREPVPAVYCRHCGRSGWAVYSPERDPHLLRPDPAKIYRASVSEKRLVRAMIQATRQEVRACAAGEPGAPSVLGTKDTWELVAERLAFQMILEFGLRSRQGRTLELTRTAAVEVPLANPGRIEALARDVQTRGPGTFFRNQDRYLVLVLGILDRLRMGGGITHHWLNRWLELAGTRRYTAIWGRRPDGMPAFPQTRRGVQGVSSPKFLLARGRNRTEFDVVDTRQGWYANWASRCLGITAQEATSYLPRLLELLADEDVLATRTAEDGTTPVRATRRGRRGPRPSCALAAHT